MKIRSVRSQALLTTCGDTQVIGGSDGQKQFLFKVVYLNGETKQKGNDQYCFKPFGFFLNDRRVNNKKLIKQSWCKN